MRATADYHNFVDVEEFIDNAHDDMIAQWVFEPQKTRKHHVKCITFNSAHTSWKRDKKWLKKWTSQKVGVHNVHPAALIIIVFQLYHL